MTVDPFGPEHPATPGGVGIPKAARGLVLVFAATLLFFGFVVGSGLLGAVGQGSLAFVFACTGLLYLWFHLDGDTRHRYVLETRGFFRRSSSAD